VRNIGKIFTVDGLGVDELFAAHVPWIRISHIFSSSDAATDLIELQRQRLFEFKK
jgi:hypothetical protein